MRGVAIGGIALVVITAFPAEATASMISFDSLPGLEGLGSYSGTCEWTAPALASGECGLLEFTLTNTSPARNGGFLTGFGFRLIDGLTASFQHDSVNLPGWEGINDFNAPPFGMFDAGAALGGDWTGGGSPNNGIGVGETMSFRFDVCGPSDLIDTIDIEDLFDKTSDYEFVARFKGFDNDGSDKVPANLPAPGALALLAAAGAVARRRR